MSTLTLAKPLKILVTAMDEPKYHRLRACDRVSVSVMDSQDRVALLEIYGCILDENSLAKQYRELISFNTDIELTNLKRRKLMREGKIRSVYTVNDLKEITIY